MSGRNRVALGMLVLSASFALHASSPAEETPAIPESPRVEPPASIAGPRAVDRATLTPMHREIFDAVETERLEVEALNQRYLAATLLDERIAIQKEIEAVKKNGMISVYEIQLRYAEADGRVEVAGLLKSAIEAIRNPKRLEIPEEAPEGISGGK